MNAITTTEFLLIQEMQKRLEVKEFRELSIKELEKTIAKLDAAIDNATEVKRCLYGILNRVG